MKRLLLLVALCALNGACMRSWVGRPVAQLEREFGRPRSIQERGGFRIYVYPDTLAGSGQMTFAVDTTGVIRAWNATANVDGVFGDGGIDLGGNDGGSTSTGVLLGP